MKRAVVPNAMVDVVARKAQGRRDLAARPIAEKLAILDEMRRSLEAVGRKRAERHTVPISKRKKGR